MLSIPKHRRIRFRSFLCLRLLAIWRIAAPRFHRMARKFIWSTVGGGEAETRKIYFVQFIDGKWTEAQIAPFSGKFHDDQPFFSTDGRQLVFASKRPKAPAEEPNLGIWRMNRSEKGWTEPQLIVGFWTPSLTRNGTMYFLDIKMGYKQNCGIFRSEYVDGKYNSPEFLPQCINQEDAADWCPFIAPDESYLIFSSDRAGGYGSGDLYISFRDENGGWQEPINLGAPINTERQERFPGVSPDGKYLFFTRHLKPPYYHDLYWVSANCIENLRKIR